MPHFCILILWDSRSIFALIFLQNIARRKFRALGRSSLCNRDWTTADAINSLVQFRSLLWVEDRNPILNYNECSFLPEDKIVQLKVSCHCLKWEASISDFK